LAWLRSHKSPVKELRHPQLAEEDLATYCKAQDTGRIDVDDMRFGYFELGYQDVQRVLQPAYSMPMTLVGPDERVRMKTVHVFAAATNAIGTLIPPSNKVVRQPRRE